MSLFQGIRCVGLIGEQHYIRFRLRCCLRRKDIVLHYLSYELSTKKENPQASPYLRVEFRKIVVDPVHQFLSPEVFQNRILHFRFFCAPLLRRQKHFVHVCRLVLIFAMLPWYFGKFCVNSNSVQTKTQVIFLICNVNQRSGFDSDCFLFLKAARYARET